MNKIPMLLVASIVAISTSPAIAEPGNWYIGAGAGMSTYKDWVTQDDITAFKDAFAASLGLVNFNGTQTADSEDRATGFKLFGGYRFNQYIAAELSYIDMGEVDANSSSSGTFYDAGNNAYNGDIFASAKASVDAFTLDASLNYPVASFVVLFAKAGIYTADADLEFNANTTLTTVSFNDSVTESSTGLHVGIGADFKLTDAIGLRAEWERLDNVEADNGESDVDLLSASLIYSF